jgi:putative protease
LTVRRSGGLPELLAPAGSWEALEAAIESGADAVYLAGRRFGARKGAKNFDDSELERAIDHSHLRGVKVYVAVNTLIPEREVEDVARRLVWLHEVGADAVLVQDPGVIRLARDLVPKLELHASTQMTICSLEGARWAAEVGLKRAVLARELSLAEVEEIANGAPLGVEVFVHGALCYSYSGQCLLSSIIGGRSGNRGLCAQPCRKAYRLLRSREQDAYGRPTELEEVSTRGRYLLSTKDLAVYPHLEELVKAPIEALKIEGRMRSPEYVRVVVSIYRRALDAISRGEWAPSAEDERDLALAFNREFTAGCIGGAGREDLVSSDRPDNRGLRVGKVASWDGRRREVAVKIDGDLVPGEGDGLVIFSGKKELGLVVRSPLQAGDGLIRLSLPEAAEAGSEVFLTRRAGLGESRGPGAEPEIPIDLLVRWEEGRPILEGKVFLSGGKVVKAELKADFSMEPAISRPLSEGQIEAQLRKTGGTLFVIREIEMDYPSGLFAPLGEINRLRREFLEVAKKEIAASFRPSDEEGKEARVRLEGLFERRGTASRRSPSSRSKPSVSVYASTLEAATGAVEGGCRRVYFEPVVGIADGRRCRPGKTAPGEFLETLRRAKEICDGCDAELVWKWPRIARRRFLDFARPLLGRAEVEGVMVEGVGLAEAARAEVPKMRVSGSVGLNVWNGLAVEALAPSFQRLTLSPELSVREMEELLAALPNRPDLEVLVQGNVEAMVAENCLLSSALGCDVVAGAGGEAFWGIEDETGRVFPVRRDGDCRTHIYNAVELSLIDEVPKIVDLGVESIAIDARGRKAEYARRMAEIYGEALEEGDLDRLKGEVREISLGGITKGAFLRRRNE